MSVKLGYSIKFVADMNKAVLFYRDVVGLTLKFSSPEWTEFATGETSLALHISSELNPPGGVQLGFWVPDIQAAYEEMQARDVSPVANSVQSGDENFRVRPKVSL